MVFNSLTFLLFFGVILALHRLPLPWRAKKLNLLIASYLFYAAWNPPFVVLLWISTAIDWFVARGVARSSSRGRRRSLLAVSLLTNLGLLASFKYGAFLLANFSALVGVFGIDFAPAAPDLFLPIGISFYTFQTLSYSLDVYRGKIQPSNSLLDYALFVTFFPQLVAGPIVRAGQFLPQCDAQRPFKPRELSWGASLLVIGLFEKVVLADALLAPIADRVYESASLAGCVDAWVGTLAFSGQIFFDFAGYSTCAIGVALCLGFALPDNFKSPYAAQGFSDFWKRWHISLSSWMRDYLYVSLGGSRVGGLRTSFNLMMTMVIVGFWHGAEWRFALWGGIHGIYLLAEHLIRRLFRSYSPQESLLRGWCVSLLTYLAVVIAWVPFRADSLDATSALLGAMFAASGSGSLLLAMDISLTLSITTAMLLVHWITRERSIEQLGEHAPWQLRAILLAGMLLVLILLPGESSPFIYFQF